MQNTQPHRLAPAGAASSLEPPETESPSDQPHLHPGLRGLTRAEQDAVPRAQLERHDQITHSHSLPVVFRHSGWAGYRARIFEAFHRTNQPLHRKQHFLHCGSHSYVLRNLDDPSLYRIAGSTCHDRFCLPCARERSHAIALNVLELTPNRDLRFLTLTVKTEEKTLSQSLAHLYRAFQHLRRRTFWQHRVKGGVAFLEINWNQKTNRWHPHFHVLIEGKYIPQQKLKQLWYEITTDSFIIDIRRVRDTVIASKYVTKYASKPFNRTFVRIPQRLDQAILALKGRKLVVTFGTWRGITLLREPSEGAWEHVGTLDRYIQRAAAGDQHCREVLRSITRAPLDDLYAMAPRLPPTGPDRPITLKQLTWLGTWQKDGTWQNPQDP